MCLCEMVLRIHRSWTRRQKITWLTWDRGLLRWSVPGSALLLRPACLPLWLQFALPLQSRCPPDWLVWVSLVPWVHNIVYILDIGREKLICLPVLMWEYRCFADVGSDSVTGTLSSLTTCQPQDDFDMFAQTRTGTIPERKKYETNQNFNTTNRFIYIVQ